jgi:hypothetical protein
MAYNPYGGESLGPLYAPRLSVLLLTLFRAQAPTANHHTILTPAQTKGPGPAWATRLQACLLLLLLMHRRAWLLRLVLVCTTRQVRHKLIEQADQADQADMGEGDVATLALVATDSLPTAHPLHPRTSLATSTSTRR